MLKAEGYCLCLTVPCDIRIWELSFAVLSHSSSDHNLQCLLTSTFGSSLSLVFQSLNFYAISKILSIALAALNLKAVSLVML